MQWFSQNWVWVLFFTAFIAMHMFGHGGHGGHGGHSRDTRGDGDDRKPAGKDDARDSSKREPGHHH